MISITEENYMKIFDTGGYLTFWDCLVNAIKNHRFASLTSGTEHLLKYVSYEPVHDISYNVVCATSKASDQPAHTRSLIRAFASRMSIL